MNNQHIDLIQTSSCPYTSAIHSRQVSVSNNNSLLIYRKNPHLIAITIIQYCANTFSIIKRFNHDINLIFDLILFYTNQHSCIRKKYNLIFKIDVNRSTQAHGATTLFDQSGTEFPTSKALARSIIKISK
jgi:hypothetical protein